MRETIKEVLLRTEQNQVGEYVIDYNYSLVADKIEGAVTATVHPYGRIVTYNGVDFVVGFTFNANDEVKAEIENQIVQDLTDIVEIFGMAQ